MTPAFLRQPTDCSSARNFTFQDQHMLAICSKTMNEESNCSIKMIARISLAWSRFCGGACKISTCEARVKVLESGGGRQFLP